MPDHGSSHAAPSAQPTQTASADGHDDAAPATHPIRLIPALRPVDHESLALLIAVVAFGFGAIASTFMYWGRQLPIDGRDSLGDFTGLVSAVAATLAFGATRLIARRNLRLRSADGALPGIHWFDFVALSLAHGAIALLGWIGVATIMAHSFTGAIVFTTPAILITAGATALSAYISSISASAISPRQLSLVLAVFLVVGMVAAMLSSADPQWWKLNLSALGITHDISALAFNITLILSGVIITTIARLATTSLPDQTPRDRRHRVIVRTLFVLLGILLGCVGVFPVSDFLLIHNTVATGMTVAFAALVFGLPTLIPTMPRLFVGLGFSFVAAIILLAVLFAFGIYNLTAVELVAALLIFTWIILFLRNVETIGRHHAAYHDQVPASA
ncbi:MAG: hypothetical protein GX871_05140 [Microbacteriaceae bacterium]|nr:hypothetical protein [Microbacteriaceae bacterium]